MTQAREITDWLAQHSSNRTETLVIGGIVSTPKSWALAAVGDQRLQRAIQAAMPSAAQAYTNAMREHSEVRIHDRSAPKEEQEAKEQPRALRAWAAAHTVSGAGDPHFHLHVITATRARGSSGRWGHLWQRTVFKRAGRIAQEAALHELRQAVTSCGYALSDDGEIAGIGHDRRLIEAASRAQTGVQMIEAAMATQGIVVGHEQGWRLWRQFRAGYDVPGLPDDIAEQIRELIGSSKNSETLEHALDQAFGDDARRVSLVKHWSAIYDRDLVDLAREAREQAQRAPEIAPADWVVAHMASYRTSATPWQMVAWCVGAVGPEKAGELLDQLREDPRVIVGSSRWATTEQAVREDQILQRVEALVPHGEMSPSEALATTAAAMTVVSGVAGAGKTTLLTAAQPSWGNRTVWATARNATMAHQNGRDLGCRSMSLHALGERITQGEGPSPGDVVIVDEVALLDHPYVQLILDLAESGCLVKCLGDEKQLPGIDGTTSARLLIEAARAAGQPWLDVSRRCEAWGDIHDELRRVVDHPGDTDTSRLMAGLRVVPVANAAEAVNLNPEGEVVTATNATRLEVAQAMARPPAPRDERRIVRARDDVAIWTGDKVVCRENVWRRGHLVLANGEQGELVAVGPKAVVVRRTRDGEEISLARHEVEDVISLGGAWTADAAQGQTFLGRGTVLVSGAEASEWLYSAMTRFRELPTLAVTVDDTVPPGRRQAEAEAKVARVLDHTRRAGTVAEMAEVDNEFAASLTARMNPKATGAEQEATEAQTEQEAPVTSTEPEEAREAPVTAQGLSQAQEAQEAAVSRTVPDKWYTQAELDAARTSWLAWRRRELATVPPVVVVDEAAVAGANEADERRADEAEQRAAELRGKATAVGARRPELAAAAEDAYLMARDLAQVIDAGPGRFGRRAERVEEARAQRAEIAEQWGEQYLPDATWTDEQAKWRGAQAASRIVDARVQELAGEAEREAGSARVAKALVERREAQVNQARERNARREARVAEINQTAVDKVSAIGALQARRDKLVAALPPEVVAGADEARNGLLRERQRQQQAEQEQERQRLERQQHYQPPPAPVQSYDGPELTL